jgi:hypothetical protein
LTCEFDTVVYISKYWIGCFWGKHSGSSLLPYCYQSQRWKGYIRICS